MCRAIDVVKRKVVENANILVVALSCSLGFVLPRMTQAAIECA
ncbi:hypothetical protein ACLEEB_05945 [Lonsdalea quercina]